MKNSGRMNRKKNEQMNTAFLFPHGNRVKKEYINRKKRNRNKTEKKKKKNRKKQLVKKLTEGF